MQKPNLATGQACLSSTVPTAHNILLPAGVISRTALQSLCLWYSDRNVSLSTLKSPSFRAFVLLYCCIDIRTKSNTDECGTFITYRIHIFVTFSFVMPWSTSTRIEAQPELSTRQQQHSHHVVLQAFAYKTATPREATNTLEYLKNLQSLGMLQSLPWETRRSQTNITSTQKWKSAASNQQSHMVRA